MCCWRESYRASSAGPFLSVELCSKWPSFQSSVRGLMPTCKSFATMLPSADRNPQETPMRAFLSACLLGAAAAALAAQVAAAPAPAAPTTAAVLTTYGDIAHAMYEDSLNSARTMQTAINAFLANPTPATLTAARN